MLTCFVRLANKEVVFGANNDVYSHRVTLNMYSEHVSGLLCDYGLATACTCPICTQQLVRGIILCYIMHS